MDTAPGPAPVCRALKNPPRNSSNLGAKTLSMSCNCGETTVFPTRQRACQQPCPSTDSDPTSTTSRDIDHQSLRACNKLSRPPRTATVGARLSPPRLNPRTGPEQQGHRQPCSCTATGESQEDQGNLHLRHDRDVNDLAQASDELQLWDLDCLPQQRTNLLDLHNTHRSPCQCTAGESLWFSEQDHGNLPLRHDRK